jgi:hypothetical protein
MYGDAFLGIAYGLLLAMALAAQDARGAVNQNKVTRHDLNKPSLHHDAL